MSASQRTCFMILSLRRCLYSPDQHRQVSNCVNCDRQFVTAYNLQVEMSTLSYRSFSLNIGTLIHLCCSSRSFLFVFTISCLVFIKAAEDFLSFFMHARYFKIKWERAEPTSFNQTSKHIFSIWVLPVSRTRNSTNKVVCFIGNSVCSSSGCSPTFKKAKEVPFQH